MSLAGIAPKAALLDVAAEAGIAVPAGFVVSDGTEVSEPPLQGRYAVRSAFGAEDGATSSLAGWFDSFLDVDAADVIARVDDVRASADRRDGTFRCDVLVMEMVAAEHAGVAFSEPGTYDDLVNVTSGLADRLVSGEVEGDRMELPRLESADAGWQTRLQALLQDVRKCFGDEPWDVEWADDGATCWLVQIRPITAPPRRDETLTAANHAEILPRLPSQFMTSIVAEAGPDLFEWYRRRVPGLPADRDFLHVVAGRPMINLSLLEDMMRHLGLPTAMVAESIGGTARSAHPVSPGRLVRRSPALARLGVSVVGAVVFARRNRRRAASIGMRPAERFTDAVDDMHDAYVALVTGMFPLSSSIGPPLAILRRVGTLLEHASRHRTITVELAERHAAIAASPTAQRDAQLRRFLAEFGHRGVYESDIARPRYRDEPDAIVGTGPPVAVRPASERRRRTLRGLLTWPVWAAGARPLAARELLRHEAMRSFADIRDSLVRLAGDAVAGGQLRSIDDLWLLDADEVRRLDDGWTPDAAFWSARERHRDELDRLDVPHVVQRFDDPATWASGSADAGNRLSGLPLTAGTIAGRAWVLDEPAFELPDGFDRDTTVLVARSIDAGWIATISLVSAVVVEIGGDLSHGSILVRELGVTAITNVSGATRRVHTGDRIDVDADAGVVRIDADGTM